MEARIKGEDDRGIGVQVQDNQGEEHTVAMGFDGKIQGHSQDSYPDDPPKRTDREDEMVSQARRYAQWYVYQERECDTLPSWRNPDRIAAMLMTLHGMDTDSVREFFGAFYHQLRSHSDDSVMPPIEIEAAKPVDEPIIYKQSVFLDVTREEVRGLCQEYTEQVEAVRDDILKNVFGDGMVAGIVDGLTGAVKDEASEYDVDFPAFEVESVADLAYMYHLPGGGMKTVEGSDSCHREPDARFELLAPPLDSVELFKAHLMRNLLCQIRDVFLGMGIEPPDAYRVLGVGFHKHTMKYEHFEMYPKYYDPETDIPGYTA